MDKTSFMILEGLTRNLGRSLSIHGLTEELNKGRQKAYYKNVYDRVKELEKEGCITLEKIGNSSVILLNFGSYGLLSLLSQFELVKKRRLIEGDCELGMLFLELDACFKRGFRSINSISVINPIRNRTLNRAEFLFIMKEPEDTTDEILGIHKILMNLEKIHTMKLDCLILRESEFFELAGETAHNPLKEMLSEQTVLAYPEDYWRMIKKIFDAGVSIKTAGEINPADISESDIVYNLGRFGYKELGAEIGIGMEYCIETLLISLLLQNDARRITAIPAILDKNMERGRKPMLNLLVFLALKYKKAGRLLGLLASLAKYSKNKEVDKAIRLMDGIGIKPEEIDEKAVMQKLQLYDGNQKR